MADSRSKRILIVDDLPHWRKLLSALLTDYELVIQDTYDGAVKAIESLEFNVAIFDLRLEDDNIFNVDGMDLVKKMKLKQPEASIVILTGYRESVRDQILREYRPDEILNKETFNNEEFRTVIQQLAHRATGF